MVSQSKYTSEGIKEIARRLKTQREKAKLNQRELGDKIGVKKDVIQRLESGKAKTVDKSRLYRLALQLDCNPAYLTLESDDPRTLHSDMPPHYTAPAFMRTAESFLYAHSRLREDFTYAAEYMSPDFQNELVKIVHTFVTFHKCGVHYPNIDPADAVQIGFKECDQFIPDHFFEKDKQLNKKWKYPRREADIPSNIEL